MRELTTLELDVQLAEQLPARELMGALILRRLLTTIAHNGNGNGNGNGNSFGSGLSVLNGNLNGDLNGNSLVIELVL
jgi:hypothetical protein